MKVSLVLIAAVLVLAVTTCGGLALAVEDVLYVCNCADCKCNTVSTSPGKCECGEDLVSAHVLKIAENKATLCLCGKDCACKLNQADPSKCACGKPVKEVSLKGLSK